MQRDDRVTVPLMPHLGTGIIELVVGPPFNRAVVRFHLDGHTYSEDFDPTELEPAPTLARTT